MSTYRELDLNLTTHQKALKEGVHQFAKQVLRAILIGQSPQKAVRYRPRQR